MNICISASAWPPDQDATEDSNPSATAIFTRPSKPQTLTRGTVHSYSFSDSQLSLSN